MKRIPDQQREQSAWLSASAARQPGQVGGRTISAARSGSPRSPAKRSGTLRDSIWPCYRGHAAESSALRACRKEIWPMVLRVTDKALLRRRLARAHARAASGADFLMNHVVADLADRLAGVERHFDIGVAFAGQTGTLAAALGKSGKVGRVFRIEAAAAAFGPTQAGAVADEEALPLAPASIDLFASALALQWTNDLPGTLVQIRQALKP